jgi:hypothetical protein
MLGTKKIHKMNVEEKVVIEVKSSGEELVLSKEWCRATLRMV